MSHAYKVLLLVLLCVLVALGGCGQQKNTKSNFSRIRDLEARNAKLEEDYRAVAAERTGMGNKVAATQQQVAQLEQKLQELESASKERDDLRDKVSTVASEREALQTHLQRFAKELQTLAGRVDATLTASKSSSVMSTVSRQTQR